MRYSLRRGAATFLSLCLLSFGAILPSSAAFANDTVFSIDGDLKPSGSLDAALNAGETQLFCVEVEDRSLPGVLVYHQSPDYPRFDAVDQAIISRNAVQRVRWSQPDKTAKLRASLRGSLAVHAPRMVIN